MSAHDIPSERRTADYFYTIDLGFVNRRLCLAYLPDSCRFRQHLVQSNNPMAELTNDRLLVDVLVDFCRKSETPTLRNVLDRAEPQGVFLGTEQLPPCQEVAGAPGVDYLLDLDIDVGKPVHLAYHTEHIVSTTGRERLEKGALQSVLGRLHNHTDRFEIEPLIMGTPLLDHHWNGSDQDRTRLMFSPYAHQYGEILPEDIDEFKEMNKVTNDNADAWMAVMQRLPEEEVKKALAKLLGEPTKKDWSGESNDHFSRNVHLGGRGMTAAFLLKGPAGGKRFKEMTIDMCGSRANQILRLTESDADISIVQHCHQISTDVEKTLRACTIQPGARPSGIARKYCLIDGQATYRILKAYGLLPL